jgi:hypothetical protein
VLSGQKANETREAASNGRHGPCKNFHNDHETVSEMTVDESAIDGRLAPLPALQVYPPEVECQRASLGKVVAPGPAER